MMQWRVSAVAPPEGQQCLFDDHATLEACRELLRKNAKEMLESSREAMAAFAELREREAQVTAKIRALDKARKM